MIMATLHDTRVAGFMPLTRIGSTGCIGMKASGEKPKKLANGKLTKQASSVSDTVLLASKVSSNIFRLFEIIGDFILQHLELVNILHLNRTVLVTSYIFSKEFVFVL